MRMMLVVCGLFIAIATVPAQQGGIRGNVTDLDFEAPLPGVKIRVSETGQEAVSGDAGSYYLEGVEPGAYTLLFSKSGYARLTRPDVVVSAGQLTELDIAMEGEYEEMDELVVRDIQLGGASEIGLLNLRFESSALMDSVGADLMGKAGVSDAAQALTLVPGTTIQDGKYAVVRGLPDRYVNSQMNGVRLPTADPDKRAVQLDQFPAAMIESVQVSKTFTPDQQGDASGGAVNIVLKGIPDERILKVKFGTKYKTTVGDAGSGFLVDDGVDMGTWGHEADGINPQDPGTPWSGRVGVSRDGQPAMYDWSVTAGDKLAVGESGLKLGFISSLFYKRDASYYKGGKDDKYFLDYRPYEAFGAPRYGTALVPRYSGSAYGVDFSTFPFAVGPVAGEKVRTSLYDVEKGSQELQWGLLGAIGAETENHALTLLYSYNFSGESTARLAEDTRGKYSFFPGHDPYDPTSEGGADSAGGDFSDFAPFRRNESLDYTERTASSLQLNGSHTVPVGGQDLWSVLALGDPELDWTVARSASALDTPDRRTLSSLWYVDGSGVPRYAVSAGEGGIAQLQRKWREVEEKSTQYFLNVKLPFETGNGGDGALKLGVFDDQVKRTYDENTFYTTENLTYSADWNEQWSDTYLSARTIQMEDSPLDVSYDGDQSISAWYYMGELPLCSFLKLTGGTRFEKTEISTAMRDVDSKTKLYIPRDNYSGVDFAGNEADANASVRQDDVLPALGLELTPHDKITLRASYAETLARMTFKELTPIQQIEEIGDDVFIGNPELKMSALKNYDLRCDYAPYPGGLVSLSWFYKAIEDPIDYRQVLLGGSILATTADNYSEGKINGYEVEVRQSLGEWWRPLEGLDIGGNLTVIESEINASGAEVANLRPEIVEAEYGPGVTRDMMGTPEFLYNLNGTYTVPGLGTELGLFYTVKGDALKAAGTQENGKYIPHVYEKEFATLNFSISQPFADRWKIGFKIKNLLDPEIESVYRSGFTGEEKVKTSYRKGVEYSLGLSGTW